MAPLITALLLSLALSATDPLPASEEMKATFTKSFPAAEKVAWHEADNYHLVSFFNNNVQCRMYFTKDGEAVRTVRYYGADGLPPYIRACAGARYPDRTLHGVTEVSNAEGTTYHLILHDSKFWYEMTCTGTGALQLEKRMKKA